MQDQPDYLSSNHIRIFDARHKELEPSQINWYSEDATHYSFKQDPGSFNSLGSIRINFPSQYGVYMHDTPLKNLFGDDFRFHSSGCVRVQNVRQLVAWLLEGTKGWSLEDIDRVIKSGEQKNRATDQAGAAALGLHHRMGDRRRRGAVPRGYLRQGRPSRRPGGDDQSVTAGRRCPDHAPNAAREPAAAVVTRPGYPQI